MLRLLAAVIEPLISTPRDPTPVAKLAPAMPGVITPEIASIEPLELSIEMLLAERVPVLVGVMLAPDDRM